MTPATTRKVIDLLAQKRIQPKGIATVYEVQGDHSTYIVVIGDGFSSCTCPGFWHSRKGPVAHGGEHGTGICSHLVATELLSAALADEAAREGVAA